MFKKLTKNVVLNKGIYFKIKNLDLSKPLVEEGGTLHLRMVGLRSYR